MNTVEANVSVGKIGNIIKSYSEAEAISYGIYKEEYISKKSKLNVRKNINTETLPSYIEKILYSKNIGIHTLSVSSSHKEDIEYKKNSVDILNISTLDKNLLPSYTLNEKGFRYRLSINSKLKRIRHESYSDIETSKSTLKITKTPVLYNKMDGYSTLNIIYKGEANPNSGSGSGLKNIKYSINMNTFIEFKLDFIDGKINTIKGLPSGIEFISENNSIKGIPKTHGISNCIIQLSNGNEIKLEIEVLAMTRKF